MQAPKTNQPLPLAVIQNTGRSQQQHHHQHHHQQQLLLLQKQQQRLASPNHGRRGLVSDSNNNGHHQPGQLEAGKRHSNGASSVSPSQLSISGKRRSGSGSGSGSNQRQASPPSPRTKQYSQTSAGSSNDSLRYEYDDHYFLTDPDEFIYEFFPLAPEWQLIKQKPISLAEFEQLPFVRSLFFKYGLYFPQTSIKSVLYADSTGATTIKIGMPTHMIPSLIFHYNLKYYDNDLEHYDGISLKRFVMQSVESG